MADTVTTNKYIGVDDGWVQIAPTASTFVRVSAWPCTHPFFLFFGATAPARTPATATGTVTLTNLPAANNSVTIDTEKYTFKVARANPFEVTIGTDVTETAANLAAAINTDSQILTATSALGVATLTTKFAGARFNYTLAKTGANITLSGTAMTGGADAPEGVVYVCEDDPFYINVTTAQPLFARVSTPVHSANRDDGKLRLDVIYGQ